MLDDLQHAGGLVDLHCHVLPALDDGAADLADSLAMAREAAADGVAVICATPHIRDDHDVLIHELPERVAALNAALRAEGIPVIVERGGEVAAPLAPRLTDAELAGVTLGGGEWILLEPAAGPMDDALQAEVDALHARGLRCLIAHPERHAGGDAGERLHALVNSGALVQVTAALLVGHPAAPTMLHWATQGLVHVVGSDAHSAQFGRPATVAEGLAELATVPEVLPHLEWMARTAPQAILSGVPLTSPFT